MKKLSLILFLFVSLGVSAQFNPTKHTLSNKPYVANGKPTDARSFYYDPGNFTYRPYANRAEILSTLNSTASRTGNFPIFLDSAGVRYELWFRSGTTDADLQLKDAGTAGNTIIATTLADLKTKMPSTSYAVTMGTNTAGDGGGREYFWDAFNNTAADGISIIIPDGWEGTGRWVEQKKIYKVHARQLGLYGDNRTTEAAAIKSAFTLATSKGWEIDLTGMTLNLNGDSIVLSNQLNLTSSNRATSIIRNAKYIIPKGGMVSKYITFKNFTNSVIGFTGKLGSQHYPNGGKLTLDIQDNDFIENYQDVAELTPASTSDTSGTVAMLYHSVFARNNFIKSKYASFHADVQYDGLVLEGNTWEGTGDSAVYNFTLHIGLDGANNVFKQRGLRAYKNFFRNIIHNQDPTGTFYGVLLSGKGMIYDGNIHDNFSAPVYLRGDDIQVISPQFLNSVQFVKYALIIKDGNPEGSLKINNPLIKGYYGTGIYVDSRFRNISITTPDITLDPLGAYAGDAGIRVIAGSSAMKLLNIKGGSITNNQTSSGTYAIMLSSSGSIETVDIDGVAIESKGGGVSAKLINSAGRVMFRNSPSVRYTNTFTLGGDIVDVDNNKYKYLSGSITNLYAKTTGFIRNNLINPDSALLSSGSALSRIFNIESDPNTRSAEYFLSENMSDFRKLVNFLRIEDTVGTIHITNDRVVTGVNGTTSAYINSAAAGVRPRLRLYFDNFKNPFNAQLVSSVTDNQEISIEVKNGELGRQSPFSFTGLNQSYDTLIIENVKMPWKPIVDKIFTYFKPIRYTDNDSVVAFYGGHFKQVDGLVRLQDSIVGGSTGYMPFIDVREYGAVGDSTTNNTTAFRDAIAYAKAIGGGIVYIPTGVFFTDSLAIPRRVSLYGAGVGATRLILNNNSTASMMLSLHNTDESKIQDITFDGNKTNQTDSINGIVIDTDAGTNVPGFPPGTGDPTNYNYQLTVERVYVRNFTGNGIVALHPAWVFAVRNYRVRDCDGWGVWNESTDSEFNDNGVANNGLGGIYNRGANTRFVGGKVLWNGRDNPNGAGIYCYGGNRSQFIGMEIQESYYHGIVLDNTSDAVVQVVSDMNNTKRRPDSLQLGASIDSQDVNSVGYALKMIGAKNNSINVQITSGFEGLKFTQFGKYVDGNSTGNVFVLNERKQMLGDYIQFPAKNTWLTWQDGMKIHSADADFSIGEDTSFVIVTSTLSGDKTITLPDPATTLMKKIVIVFRGSTGQTYNWNLASTVGYVTPTGTDSLPNNSVVTFERFDNGSGQWRITNIWEPLKVATSTTGATTTSGNAWYVDNVRGSDANDGRSAATAFKTIAKLNAQTLTRGDQIFLARGSEWREELRTDSKTQIHVAAYGTGQRPILNGADVIPNQSLIKYPGFTNLYYFVHTNKYTGAISEHMVWEDDKFLKRAVSKADADTVTNGAFFTTSNPSPETTDTVWIKPSGSISPYNNGKEYEVSKRAYGVIIGDSSTIQGIHTKYSGANNGSLVAGLAGHINDCLAEYGGKHNLFIKTGLVENTTAWKAEQRGTYGGTTLFVAYNGTGTGSKVTFRNCWAIGGDGYTNKINGNEVGYYSHTTTDTDPYDSITIENSYAINVHEAINVGARHNVVTGNEVTFSTNQLVVRPNITSVRIENNRFLGHHADYTLGSTANVGGGVAGATITFKNNWITANRSTNAMVRFTGNVSADSNTFVYRTKAGGSFRALQIDGGSLVSFKHNLVDSAVNNLYLAAGVTTPTPANIDSNVYKGGAFRINGTDYADFTAYRAALTTQDVNSISGTPGFYGTPTNDYTITEGSSADLLDAGYSKTVVGLANTNLVLSDTLKNAPLGTIARKGEFMWIQSPGQWRKAFALDNKTYSSGITDASDVVTNDLITGKVGGQTIIGGTASGNGLTLSSTSHATKGKILFGTSAYDEANNRLGILNASPQHPLHLGYGGQLAIYGTVDETTNYGRFRMYSNTSNVISYDLEKAGTGPSTGYHAFKINGSAVMDLGTVNTSFYNNILPNSNNTRDIGRNDLRWKNLFLSGNVGIGGSSAPTARLQIAAGTGAPNTASLIIDGGTLLAAPVNGAIENNGTHLYVTLGGIRYQLDQQTPTTRQLVKVSDSDYTIATGTGDITVVFWTMTAGHTCYIPSASTNTGRRITIKHGGDGNFDITLSPAVKSNSSTSTATIGQGSSIMFESDGTDWIKVY